MVILFEAIKILFFLFTIFLATVLLKGEFFLSPESLGILNKILFPAYLVLVGVLMGYILALIYEDIKDTDETRGLLYTRMFIIGIVIGAVLSLSYIFII